ncbi:Mov34/MPN/PAD-1 family protein [Sphingomonas silueang]|uniref:Mov34/MPN/PAD-1 family protein n=1 Tax=Sphingomonas silueang TaxID=3156617 RepID=UPI0032B32F87
MTPLFSSDLLLALLRAAADSRIELCGLLRGEGRRIVAADPAANVAADPARTFEIDPAALFAAHRDARRPGGAAVVGCYHSHPSGDPMPSATDAAQAAPDGMLWLILGHAQARLWRAVAAGAVHGRFDPVRFGIADVGNVEKKWLTVHMDVAGQKLLSAPEREPPR